MSMVCRPVRTPGELATAYRIRHQVFVLEQGVPLAQEQDADDAQAWHVLAWDGERPLGTARLVDRGQGVAKIGRVAVLKEARGLGAGVALMACLHEQARERGYASLILDAQVAVLGFYERLGYRPEGPRFLDCGIEHQRMRRGVS